MVKLRRMRADEFSAYVEYFVPDYAADISANYDVDIQTATKRAEQAVEESLAQGVETPGQLLLCIVAERDEADTLVGYLWCQSNAENQTVFISDFCILPPHRGKGFARLALAALNEWFSETEFGEFRLRVAAGNSIAKNLYLSAGFAPTGINMRKPIERA
ncbi:RimJ/RimL family protein N-acetyltransferase [Thioclava sp. ES.031]|uniref:GNAT family N-acetyltransferase n=1 Tax=Thioclava sp. ES.031 TaxID=1798203 RepID=UPI000C01932D|nr:GNAT family N-acetyltransferase [Thioclava sp. ES.031]PFG63059.1 RimJ/RimL family protein N-acetyltransferase [Thioclava sp. ES.031]